MITSNKLNMGFFSVSDWFLDYLSLSISSASELEWSLMSFVTPDSTSRSFHLRGRGFKKEKMARRVGGRGGGGDYLRKAIILNISVLRGDYSR